jgi:predicted translin family RNA/ssDNA-binding protein
MGRIAFGQYREARFRVNLCHLHGMMENRSEKTMNIDLPSDLIARLHQKVSLAKGLNEAEVIRLALDSLDRSEQEVKAIEEGIAAWRTGDVHDFKDFDREFRLKNGIAAGN